MVDARTLESAKERHSRAAAPRRRAPLEKAPEDEIAKDAKRWMGRALRLRNIDPHRAMLAAERAFGFYFSASKMVFSESGRADCLFGAGKALSLAASLCEGSDPRRAGRMHEEAGDHFHVGARHGTRPEEEVLKLAQAQYELALKMGGIPRVLERKIAMCKRALGL